jgi:hypothetical protein
MKTVRSVIASIGVPYYQMRSVGSKNSSEREKKGKGEDGEGSKTRMEERKKEI